MKNLICFIIIICMAASAIGQDIVIDKEGETTPCKVISVTESEVVFRKEDNSLSSLPKSDILLIQYANGKKETFPMKEALAAAPSKSEPESVVAAKSVSPVKTIGVDSIEVRKKKFYINGVEVKEKQVREIIANSNCEEALKTLKSRKGNKAFKLLGAGFLGAGVGYGVVNLVSEGESIQTIIAGGVAVFGLSAMIISSSAMAKKLRTAARQYNNCLQK
jgi:hypothetical protein